MIKRVSLCGFVCACLALSAVLLASSAQANCPGARGDLAQGEYFSQALRYMGQVDKAYCQERRFMKKDTLVIFPPKFPLEACQVVRGALDRVRLLDEIASTGPLPSDFDEFMDDLESRMEEADRKCSTRLVSGRCKVLTQLNEVACEGDQDLDLPPPSVVRSPEYTARYEAQGKCLPMVVAQIMNDADVECAEMSSFMTDLSGQLEELEVSIRERMKPKSYFELKAEGF